jgi:mono/diheme cytochrome c family protein
MRKIIFLTTVLLAACQTQADSPDTSAARGEQVFTKHCATCHGASGEGIEPWYPSLQRLAAMREPAEMVETVMTGRFQRGGEMNGHTIPIMPAWGQLTDADVAAIVNYIQQTWGDGSTITIEDVVTTRADLWELD